MKPTPRQRFESETSLLLPVIVRTCLGTRDHDLTGEQVAWFQCHVDARVRWLHANNTAWRKILNGTTNRGRDRVYTFVNHWLDAYLPNPEDYIEKHPSVVFV